MAWCHRQDSQRCRHRHQGQQRHDDECGNVIIAAEIAEKEAELIVSESLKREKITQDMLDEGQPTMVLKSTDARIVDFDDGPTIYNPTHVAPLGELLVNLNGELLERFAIARRKILIGRAAHNDIVLNTNWVSRHHAILICRDDGATLIDINSTNGMTVNSRQVKQTELRHNDIVVIGDHRIKYTNQIAAGQRPDVEDDGGLSETRVLRALTPEFFEQQNQQSSDIKADPKASDKKA